MEIVYKTSFILNHFAGATNKAHPEHLTPTPPTSPCPPSQAHPPISQSSKPKLFPALVTY